MTQRSLSPADRDVFADAARIAFANPFSEERVQLDVRVGGGSPEDPMSERARRVRECVRARLDALPENGYLPRYRGVDHEVLAFSHLLEAYHGFKDDFDRLIVDQVRAGSDSRPVPFAQDVIADLVRRGFERPDAVRNLGLFWQLRRAFWFIDRLVGESTCMKELRRNLWNNIFTSDIRWYNRYLWNRMEDFSTLLLGETGTGKGYVASAIGRSGFIPFDEKRGRFRESFTSAFVAINLSQFPESLIESELFGHRKGAFTGAVDEHPGVFASCSPHGAIFLDEIGEASGPVQIKLLRVLQERTFTPVGSHEVRRFSGRVIAATNRTLAELRSGDLFRDDFYYRLCSDVIVVPPLRERIAELPGELEGLVRHTLQRTLGEDAPDVVDLVLRTIDERLGRHYPWPGNVRELEQCVRRILLKRRYEGDRHAAGTDLRSALLARIDEGSLDAAGLVEAYCALLHRRLGSFEGVARRTGLDRRTVRKYIRRWEAREAGGHPGASGEMPEAPEAPPSEPAPRGSGASG